MNTVWKICHLPWLVVISYFFCFQTCWCSFPPWPLPWLTYTGNLLHPQDVFFHWTHGYLTSSLTVRFYCTTLDLLQSHNHTNTLLTNATKSWQSTLNPACCQCQNSSQPETLPHILCHCHSNMVSTCEHHDSIVTYIQKAFLKWSIPNGIQNDWPDIVPCDGNKVLVIDVSCPFENDARGLQGVADRKEQNMVI